MKTKKYNYFFTPKNEEFSIIENSDLFDTKEISKIIYTKIKPFLPYNWNGFKFITDFNNSGVDAKIIVNHNDGQENMISILKSRIDTLDSLFKEISEIVTIICMQRNNIVEKDRLKEISFMMEKSGQYDVHFKFKYYD